MATTQYGTTGRLIENDAGIGVVVKDFCKDNGEIRIIRRLGDNKIFIEANQVVAGEKKSRHMSILYDLSKEELETLKAGIEKILASLNPVYEPPENKQFLDAARDKECFGKCEDLEFCVDDKDCPLAYKCAKASGLKA